jgi:hypothetical protein
MRARYAAVRGAHALVLFTNVDATAIVLTNRGRNALGLTAKRSNSIAVIHSAIGIPVFRKIASVFLQASS